VQLLGAATIRASAINDIISKANSGLASAVSNDMELLHDAIADTLDEIRHLSSGLAPPDIENLRPAELVEMAIRRHERRTSTTVSRHIEGLPHELTLMKKVGLYRFIQEGLNNAVRHAGGQGQSVSARIEGDYLEAAVADTGPGIEATRGKAGHRSGHGLEGLADRMVSLDSELLITSSPQGGTRLTGRFKI
jgi:signal transduction histidine kinase